MLIKFGAILPAIWIEKWSRASKRPLKNNSKNQISSNGSKIAPNKVFFVLQFWRLLAHMVPSGSQRVWTGRVWDEKGTKKLEILRMKGSKKVVWSASLACFTTTHFSVAKAIFKKYGNPFQKCFTFYRLTLGQSSPRLGGKPTVGPGGVACLGRK